MNTGRFGDDAIQAWVVVVVLLLLIQSIFITINTAQKDLPVFGLLYHHNNDDDDDVGWLRQRLGTPFISDYRYVLGDVFAVSKRHQLTTRGNVARLDQVVSLQMSWT
jgi:hypothetical protein